MWILGLKELTHLDLLNLCLTSTYFQYNGKHYKQLHGTAMGSPVSVVVARNCHPKHRGTSPSYLHANWFRYVDLPSPCTAFSQSLSVNSFR